MKTLWERPKLREANKLCPQLIRKKFYATFKK